MQAAVKHRQQRQPQDSMPPVWHDDEPDNTLPAPNAIPADMEAERAVIGSCLIDPDALAKIATFLRPQDFFRERHGWIFEAMLRLSSRNEPVSDVVMILDEVKEMGKEVGPAFIADIITATPTAIYAEHYGRIVEEKSIRRKMIAASGKAAELAYDQTVPLAEALSKAEQTMFGISEGRIGKDMAPIRSIMSKVVERIDFLSKNPQALGGVPTGFTVLDRLLGGLQKSDLIILAARPAMGKCLGKGTKVLMLDGTLRNVEDIKTGDLLMGDDSTPRRVLGTTKGMDQLYRIKQAGAMDYVVNSCHILTLKRSRNEGGWQKGQVIDIALPEYQAKSTKWKTSFKGFKVPVDFPEQELPLDPYYFGLWLGDGTGSKNEICNPDPEIHEYLHTYAEQRGMQVKIVDTDRCPIMRVTEGYLRTQPSIQETLRAMGVLSNKHIPQVYLTNSRQNRLALLAGLLDTDGYYAKQFNNFEITLCDFNLAKQVKFLADSLGFSTSITEKSAEIKSISYQTMAWRVRIGGNLDEIPTLIVRKQARARSSRTDWRVSGITVESIGVGEYYGFELDGNGRFLLEDMTVTHNTSFALSIAQHAAKHHASRVAFFSLEMSNDQLVQRLLSMETGIDSHRLRLGNVHDDEWPILLEAANLLANTSVTIDDTPAASISDIRTKARRLYADGGLDLIIIDYMQLMTGISNGRNQENRQQEISYISRSLKNLARELNVPIIALSQLSRAVESRSDKRPMLSDLRESGAIEQDSDVVLFIYREDYYVEDTDRQNIADILVAKHRHGATGTVSLYFRKELTQFRDLEIQRTELEY